MAIPLLGIAGLGVTGKAALTARSLNSLGISGASLAALEAANIINRASIARNAALRKAIGNTKDIEKAIESGLFDQVKNKTVSNLLGESVLLSPIESAKLMFSN